MAAARLVYLLLFATVTALPERGHWSVSLPLDKVHKYVAFPRHMYKDSEVSVTVTLHCKESEQTTVNIEWMLRVSPCGFEFLGAEDHFQKISEASDVQRGEDAFAYSVRFEDPPYDEFEYIHDSTRPIACRDGQAFPIGQKGNAASSDPEPAADDTPAASSGKRRERAPSSSNTSAPGPKPIPPSHPVLAKTWVDGNYLLILKFSPNLPSEKVIAEVQVRMTWGGGNYLSALDYPLLTFYGMLGLVYIMLGFEWLVLLACDWRDLLRVQFWIGSIVFLGILESVTNFSQLDTANNYGVPVTSLAYFIALVSSLRRAVFVMVLLFLSYGYDSVKPQLGRAFYKVLFVGVLFFVLAAFSGCLLVSVPVEQHLNVYVVLGLLSLLLDVLCIFWIFKNIAKTMQTVRVLTTAVESGEHNHNAVKLSTYRYFRYALVLGLLFYVVKFIWFIVHFALQVCVRDWKRLWVGDASDSILFVVFLTALMFLFRPTVPALKYPFRQLVETADEEEEEEKMGSETLGETFIKM